MLMEAWRETSTPKGTYCSTRHKLSPERPVEVAAMGKWEGHGSPWADTDIVVTGFLSQRVLVVT